MNKRQAMRSAKFMTNLGRENERFYPLITLPLPPTDNQLKIPWVNYVGGKAIPVTMPDQRYTKYKKSFKRCWAIWLANNRDFKPFEPNKNCFLRWDFVLHLPNWQRDAQNHTKALRDVLTGNLYADDRYAYVFPSQTHAPLIDKLNPRVVLDPNPTLPN